ncbi:MAG: metallophosphoesterase [Desulfobacterales bacterium]|nr:MAG: metallophosphoesterase [Desulfobacterales bacterium]
MRIAVISDIHANQDAFQRVLADIDRARIDRIVSLGDNIGYGPDPEEVLRTMQARNIPSVLGNHEMGVLDSKYLSWFNPVARESLVKTRQMLSGASMRLISKMTSLLTIADCRFVHGFPPNSQFIYFFQVSANKKRQVLHQMPERMCFVGHTHTLAIVGFDGQSLETGMLKAGTLNLRRNKKYLLNIGSVGQPRDGNNKAKYVIWDSIADTLTVRFITYDIATVVSKIIMAGLPPEHGLRLW